MSKEITADQKKRSHRLGLLFLMIALFPLLLALYLAGTSYEGRLDILTGIGLTGLILGYPLGRLLG